VEGDCVAKLHLVTQAYGDDVYRAQALYCAWSSAAWVGGERGLTDVHVYTDEPSSFGPLEGRIELRVLTPSEISSWWGPHEFRFRTKPMMLLEMARRFPSDPVLFLDADTFWLRSPSGVLERIGPRRAVMHAREEHLGDRSDRHMRNLNRHLRRTSFRGAPVDVDRWMWNSGAIGLAPEAFGVIEDWIAFVDEVVPRYRRAIMEQYGLGMLLQQRGEVSACDDRVFHYWYQKEDYTAAVQRELEVLRALPLPDALERVREAPVHVTFRERPQRGSRFLKRIERSLFGER
jgi:hypothetical protein